MDDLKNQAVSSVGWTGISTAITTGLHFSQIAILARLLGPEAFGLVAMVMVIVRIARLFGGMGMSVGIIHRQDVTREHLSSLYWFNIFIGAAMFAILWAATPLIVLVYEEPRVSNIVFWLALTFLIAPVGGLFRVLMRKELQFKRMAVISVACTALGTAVAIASAISGQGVLALVWAHLTATASSAAISLALGLRTWRPQLHFKTADLKRYLRFGAFHTGARAANFTGLRFAQFLIGVILGAQSLGYYNMAFALVLQPISRINPILNKVALPVFAKIQGDNGRLRRSYFTGIRFISAVDAPLLLGIAAVAPTLVPSVFGPQWQAAIPLIQVLSVVALLRSTGNPIGSLVLAKGRPDLSLKWSLVTGTSQVVGVTLGAYLGGLIGVATALVVLQSIYKVAGYAAVVRRLIGPCARDYVMSIAPSTAAALIMALPVAAVGLVFSEHGGPLLLTAQVALGVVLYLGLAALLMRDTIAEAKDMVMPGLRSAKRRLGAIVDA